MGEISLYKTAHFLKMYYPRKRFIYGIIRTKIEICKLLLTQNSINKHLDSHFLKQIIQQYIFDI